jgi:AcrR family transcriptional regulator
MPLAQHPRGPGRPRDPRVDTAVIAAATASLWEVGYDRTSLEGIARKAGVSKTAIYRRWPSKGLLAYEALLARMGNQEVVDTGHIVADLHAVAAANMAGFADPRIRPILLPLLADLFKDEQLAGTLRTEYFAPRAEQIRDLIRRAVDRGELADSAPADMMPSLLTGPLVYALMVWGRPLDDAELELLVRTLLGPHLPRRTRR